jgi:hypothetical protein
LIQGTKIKIATKKCFGQKISEIDRRLATYEMLLKEGFLMLPSASRPKVPVYLLSAKSFRLLRSLGELLPLGHYESSWVLMRASYEANTLAAHLSRDEADSRRWLNGEQIPMREIRAKRLVATWNALWSSLCNKTHPNIDGLPTKPLKLDEEPNPFAFVVTDPPEVETIFQPEECEHLLLHMDMEICKGAMLQVVLFGHSILDRSMELSDRVAELYKHIVRLLGRPDLAKMIRATEREFGLNLMYRKNKV